MPIRPTTRWLSLLAIALTALALGACGDDDDSGSAGENGETATEQAAGGGKSAAEAANDLPSGVKGSTLELAAVEDVSVPSLAFSEKRATLPAGRVTVTMRNPEGTQFPHAVEIEGNGIEKAGKVVKAGGTSTVTANLKPGKYVFYCPVGSHRKDGMKGTLTVR
ncbi:MAG TPA: cupredoxin domain-containing protein [Thermoleophilaceae bacterium]|nr:cupredoxin domain-containing protein [Thermoleophilaceae bacterium]